MNVFISIFMSKSNFEKIIEFHTAFGLPSCNTVNRENLQNFKIASLRVKLIQEEFTELKTARYLIEQLDAIGDLLYVVYGSGTSFGFDLDSAFHNYCVRQLENAKYPTNIFDEKMTNFQKTYKLCTLFQLPKSTLEPPISRENGLQLHSVLKPNALDSPNSHALDNFEIKIYKLAHALLMCDTTTVQDTLVEMLYSLYCVGYICDYNLDCLFAEIHNSNMTKLCSSEQEAIDTVKWYKEYQLDRYPLPEYKKLSDCEKWVVFDKSTDKRLKSIHYVPPEINPILLKQIKY